MEGSHPGSRPGSEKVLFQGRAALPSKSTMPSVEGGSAPPIFHQWEFLPLRPDSYPFFDFSPYPHPSLMAPQNSNCPLP